MRANVQGVQTRVRELHPGQLALVLLCGLAIATGSQWIEQASERRGNAEIDVWLLLTERESQRIARLSLMQRYMTENNVVEYTNNLVQANNRLAERRAVLHPALTAITWLIIPTLDHMDVPRWTQASPAVYVPTYHRPAQSGRAPDRER